uniref:Vacuolar protein sorting 13 homolog C n=1 Tax=Callorhinchus milii TaxID=7868 RepID=A0A4W3HA74_CALMI
MVFESVVADLLNRFLGDYVENLDKSQLKLGIWGGNVVLDNLQIKENALNDLNAPFKVKAGQIDKLTLKIPWKNLYSEAVVATLDGLYVLVVPEGSIQYDAEKEEKQFQENKQKELLRIEDALQKAAEKDKPKEEKKDSFVEKLATQVIKNLQIKITSIHVRYEDDHLFLLQLVRLDCLCAYWNVNSSLLYQSSREQILVCTFTVFSPRVERFFRPMSASAKLCINTSSDVELNSPKMKLDMEVQSIDIEMTKKQYLSMMDLLESVDYMVRNIPYRKYKPNVPVHKNFNKWWQYAITGILEVHIRRKSQMWSWKTIKSHRQNLKAYKLSYKNKLMQTKPSDELLKQLQTLEKLLDVFNITLARQQAHVEVIRSGHRMLGKKGAEKQSGGWFSGLWGRKDSKKKGEEEVKSVPESINDLMTPEEKAKLYTAIGYSESYHNLTLPKQYIANVLMFKLVTTSITIREEPNVPEILKVQTIGLSMCVSQRPGAQALKVETRLEHWYVTGLKQQDVIPSLIASVGSPKSSLLNVCFEINPEESNADQLLNVQSQPVEMIYDAVINSLVEFFQTNRGLDLERLTSATLLKLEEIKERTATGLSHIIETRKVLDVRINLKPSYLVVPQTGFYSGKSNLLILDFGSFQVMTSPSFASLEEILDRAYEKFDVKLKNVQLLFSKPDQDWKSARIQHSSSQHILQPMNVEVEIAKAMVEKDTRMPKFKVSGELPLFHVAMSDEKIKSLFELADSIPFPQKQFSPRLPTKAKPYLDSRCKHMDHYRSCYLGSQESEEEFRAEDAKLTSKETLAAGDAPLYDDHNEDAAIEELTDLQLKFEIKEVVVELTRKENQEKPFLVFSVSQLGTEAKIRTFDLTATSYLKKINLDYCEIQGADNQPLHLISSADTLGSDLLKVEYVKVKLHSNLKSNFSDCAFFAVSKRLKDTDLFNFKMFAELDAFNVAVCDETCNIADIKVQDRVLSEHIFVETYTDMSKVDGKITLQVGCIQIVYLQKFIMSLLNFFDNFQTAKEAISAATAQAAEKAASSVKDFAQKSFRLSMDIHLKAPVIIVPESSTSTNAVVADLGLITVRNEFTLNPAEGFSMPVVIDVMDIRLTQLKLSRTILQSTSPQPDIQMLRPIDLQLCVKRNLAAAWYHRIPAVEIKGDLKTMNIVLSQEDLTVLMKVLEENFGEGAKESSTSKPLKDEATRKVVVELRKQVKQQKNPFLEFHVMQLGTETKVREYDLSANRNGPHFKTTFDNTEQMMRVAFSSLDLILHTQALLSVMNFMAEAFPSSNIAFHDLKVKENNLSYSEVEVLGLKLSAVLDALNIFVCDEKFSIADIKIRGMDASVSVQSKQTGVFARLRDIIVMDVDSKTLHKKAVSIIGDEVFSFKMFLYPDATEGKAYTDMSKVDGKVVLQVGCIQIVYLHKFLKSLLNFFDNFQTAKEALSAATAQAAEKAASSVKDFAQKSFRLSMDINLKAPVIIVPESSTSTNAVVADLGLITVRNEFNLHPAEGFTMPVVIDVMDIQLTQLKLSRTFRNNDSVQPDIQILQPVNLLLKVKRNLAAAWYHKISGIEINGDLKAMNVSILLGELHEMYFTESFQLHAVYKIVPFLETELVETLNFDFKFESLSVILYTKDLKQPTELLQRLDSLRLGEFRLHLITASGKMFTDGSLEVETKLTMCTLDDLREGIEKVTSRMIEKKQGTQENVMIELQYRQKPDETLLTAVLDHLYVCASVEFLLAVADFFIKAVPESSALPGDKSAQLLLKQTGKAPLDTAIDTPRPKMTVKALIMNPEVVFVANLSKADAPALVASFQCDFSIISDKESQKMIALVSDLKVLACPFLKEKSGTNITTVSLCLLEFKYVCDCYPLCHLKDFEVEVQQKADDTSNLWAIKNALHCNYWFLGVDVACEATEITDKKSETTGESFKVDIEFIQVTLECGLGHRTIPLLLAESTFSGKMQNWTSLISVDSNMTLEVLYYNEMAAIWEPLLEQVNGGQRRWSLKFKMKKNEVQDKCLIPGDDFLQIPDPQTAISISSKDTMNITVSKCCLNVLNVLAKAFSEGAASTFDYSLKDKAPYTLKNALGIPMIMQHSSNLCCIGFDPDETIDVGQTVELDYSAVKPRDQGKLSVLQRQESNLFTLTIVPFDYTEVANIPVTKPGRRLYNVRNPFSDYSVSLLAQIDVVEGNKRIIIRSPLQIKNHFSISFMVYKFVPEGGFLEPIGVANPEQEFHVPLDSYRGQLFLKPVGELENKFKESTTYITWKEELHRSSEVRCTLRCPSTELNFLPFIVNTIAIPDELTFISSRGEDEWDPAYIIHLHPTVTIRNLLPYSLHYILEGTAEFQELAEGCSADVFHSRIKGEIMELALIKYQGRNWVGHLKIQDGLSEFFPMCFTADSKDRMSIDLMVHVRKISRRLVLSIHSPYWIINKTSRVLQYRAEDVHVKHPSDFRDVVLFSFRRKNIFSKNKIQLCVSTSNWSSSFSLDTVGSYGCVKCPAKNMEYLIGVTIKMSSFNVTKVVTLTPFYTLVNKSSYELEVGEVLPSGPMECGKWLYISTAECLPLWPETTSNKLCVRVVGSEQSSKSFHLNKRDNGTLLSLEPLCDGVIVDINVADHSTVVSFTDYYDGAAPALIINHTSAVKFRFKQSGVQEEVILDPGKARLFTWADPAGNRKLNWGCAWKTGELDLFKDQFGQFLGDQNTQIHWVSFLDGRQRVLLFTEDVAVVSKARQAEDLKQFEKEITVSLHSLGLSLVNNESKQEIAYIGITSSGVVWEMKPKQRWKPFSQKHINLLESTYQKHFNARSFESWIKLESNFEVNFNTMQMRLPAQHRIRRNFLSGIHIEYKQSPHHRSLRAQLNWLQVDNQLPGAIFPIAFHPVPPPKSIALDSEPKPFVDISIITRFNEHSQVMQFKYFMVLIQEMAVKLDQGFLSAIIALFTAALDPLASTQKTNLIHHDVEALKAELMETSMTDVSSLSFFEYLHISPLKVHLSMSLDSGGEESSKDRQEAAPLQSINILLKSIGATLTDVDDLIFKLAFFETKCQFYKRDQLMWTVISHYSEQFLKQMYVLVLGLDVLGNPVGLIRGLSEGVEAFFYEPFQGAVQGPEEFAEGFVIGVRSLLGHTVGGAAGVVSRITGTVGKGLAAITMDKEYQQKRREEMNRQPKDFGDSLARGGKGLLRGVVGGFTGIVTKPVEGAKKEGTAGFFKGIGKGLVGVVARPTGGIIDMASSTFQGIKKVAESTEDVNKLRPPRCIHEDGIIRTYNRSESEGCELLEKLEIQKFEGEIYRSHYSIYGNKNANLLITNRRVLCVSDEILGHLGSDWNYTFDEFTQPPIVKGNVLSVFVKVCFLYYTVDIKMLLLRLTQLFNERFIVWQCCLRIK